MPRSTPHREVVERRSVQGAARAGGRCTVKSLSVAQVLAGRMTVDREVVELRGGVVRVMDETDVESSYLCSPARAEGTAAQPYKG